MGDPIPLETALRQLRTHSGIERVDAGVVLGSGWASAIDQWPEPVIEVEFTQLTGFRQPAAVGHIGRALWFDIAGTVVLVLAGRTHLYEGHGLAAVVHGVRTFAAYGAARVVLTNANGSLRCRDWPVGTAMLIRDHLNLTGVSPIERAEQGALDPIWSPRLLEVARAADPNLVEGVYAQLRGPHYNTFAEADWLRRIGADVVGMSTVHEAIAARAAGLEVVGLSLVTAIEGSLDQPDVEGGSTSADAVVTAAADTVAQLSGVLAALAVAGP